MAWESNMTTDQKEQYVIQLYTEGKTFKVIAQLTHTSFRDISAIIKRHQGTIEREKGHASLVDYLEETKKILTQNHHDPNPKNANLMIGVIISKFLLVNYFFSFIIL